MIGCQRLEENKTKTERELVRVTKLYSLHSYVVEERKMVFEAYDSMFRVDARYKLVKPLGKGAYGAVCSALDTSKNQSVAIKKVKSMSKEILEAKQTLREIKLLSEFGQHQNVVSLQMLQLDLPRDEIYLFLNLMDTDLHRIIQSSQKLSPEHVRHFMFQTLRGLQFLHANSVLHRDLKPANLLVNKDCHLRISDFGLSRAAPREQINPLRKREKELKGGNKLSSKLLLNKLSFAKEIIGDKDYQLECKVDLKDDVNGEEKRFGAGEAYVAVPLTRHVVTRWYRAPELMLNPDGLYSAAVDLWSVGCIFGELLSRRPLFPGENFIDQLRRIFDAVGTPKVKETEYIKNAQALKFLNSLEVRKPVNFHRLLNTTCSKTVNIVASLLRFDQTKRYGVGECFRHEYFEHTPYEPEIKKLLEKLNEKEVRLRHVRVGGELNAFEADIKNMTLEELRDVIEGEVDKFNNSDSVSDANKHLAAETQAHSSRLLAKQSKPEYSAGTLVGQVYKKTLRRASESAAKRRLSTRSSIPPTSTRTMLKSYEKLKSIQSIERKPAGEKTDLSSRVTRRLSKCSFPNQSSQTKSYKTRYSIPNHIPAASRRLGRSMYTSDRSSSSETICDKKGSSRKSTGLLRTSLVNQVSHLHKKENSAAGGLSRSRGNGQDLALGTASKLRTRRTSLNSTDSLSSKLEAKAEEKVLKMRQPKEKLSMKRYFY